MTQPFASNQRRREGLARNSSIRSPMTRRGKAFAVLAGTLVATLLVYLPGLSGDFLLDDYVNLNALGRYGGVRDIQTLLFYLTSGIADPTGRPVAMASFLLDAQTWPAEPFPFKRTNLLVHLVNGVLLYNVLTALGRRLSQDAGRVRRAALIATTLWLMNPLWASTVLYVVQRHAMLAALFVLAGIRAWIGSRDAFDAGYTRRGWLLALIAVPVFGTLAGLSKANGFLLPVLLVVLELTVLRVSVSNAVRQHRASVLLTWLPAALLLGWLCWQALQTGLDGTGGRSWTLGQRLLSQPRALCEYLWQLFFPGLNATGVFADGFAPSFSWRTPASTLPALLVVTALAGSIWALRLRWPVPAAAIGFFLAGHLVESSVIMLELYFEHRNYLPALLLFWPLAWWVSAPGRFQRWLLVGAIGYAGLMLLTTAAQARLWGDPLSLALVWAEQNPDSARAQANAFHQERAAGRDAAAEQRLSGLLDRNPIEPQFALNLLNLRCQQGTVRQHDIGRAEEAIAASRGLANDINYHWLAATLLPDPGAACGHLSEAHLDRLLEAATVRAGQPGDSVESRAREQRLRGEIALRRQDCDTALQAFDERVAVQPRPEFVQSQTALLATRCDADHALAHLDRYLQAGAPVSRASSPMLRVRDRFTQRWWIAHWSELRGTLVAEAGKHDDT